LIAHRSAMYVRGSKSMKHRATYKSLPKWWQFWKPKEKGKHSMIDILPVCDDFAPDTLAPDIEDREVCTTCYWRKEEHNA
jgi:hypothetical protein